jgi:GntR family transcriptional regulator
LPSESELADEMTVSRGSIRAALTTLATAGLIDRRQGDGTYVRNVDSPENSLMHAIWESEQLIEASGRTPTIQGVSIENRLATEEESAILEIGLAKEVVVIVRLFYADDRPIIFSINVSPAALYAVGVEAMDATLGLHGFLRSFSNYEVARIDMDISATLADEQVQRALSLEPHFPILRLGQVFRDINRRPLVYATNYHCDRKLSLHDVRPWYPWGRSI